MHADVTCICTCTVRHSVIARVLTFYMDIRVYVNHLISISAYFSCQNFVGARPL